MINTEADALDVVKTFAAHELLDQGYHVFARRFETPSNAHMKGIRVIQDFQVFSRGRATVRFSPLGSVFLNLRTVVDIQGWLPKLFHRRIASRKQLIQSIIFGSANSQDQEPSGILKVRNPV